ncbi:DUF2490 domain-containing protein [Marixanthomonas spongiae]|uniref:DUF2490 domain-containing protein n=1 Tax=Marixanthomonas spongiae TaxID=2174845 RepID=A0A2U0HVE9_9FLAO|nr:DUF2490 domain-containing protein [Marixanthomonas spongiae]PVW12825.1 DUF2490 domain-containing protein [Marixanthomonas spongiae]
MKNSLVIVFLIFAISLHAQQEQVDHYSSWNTLTIKAAINKNWFVKSEFSFRRTNFIEDWQQILLRPSIQHKINPFIKVAIGYTFSQNYSFSDYSAPIDNRENNVWQQVYITQPFKTFKVSHRIRFEERFRDKISSINNVLEINGTDYSNRLRYRFIVEILLIKKYNISALVYDEVFLDFEKTLQPKTLDQNWMFVGLRFRNNDHITITSGYHYINIPRNNFTLNNHIWETSLVFTL